MAFTARRVATNTAGETVAILDTRRFGATTLAEAKIEASRRPNGLLNSLPGMCLRSLITTEWS